MPLVITFLLVVGLDESIILLSFILFFFISFSTYLLRESLPSTVENFTFAPDAQCV